jgi:dTDP-4-amino-4,6-dideoxygalactose transaminase
LQAAALRVRLESLDEKIAEQRHLADELTRAGNKLQRETTGAESSWHRHVSCFCAGRPGRRFYDPPLHQQPSMSPYWRCELLNAEWFARRNVCLSPESTRPL